MILPIALLTGITDVYALVAIAGANAAMILFGWVGERADSDRARTDWLPYVFGCVAGIVPWICITIAIVGAEANGSVPGLVYGIYVSLGVRGRARLLTGGFRWRRARGPVRIVPDATDPGDTMHVEPLHRMTFHYPESWGGTISGDHGSEGHYYFIAEGRAEGAIAGRLRGANHPRARIDGNALPNFQGAIETDDGAHVLFDLRGYARPYPEGRRQIVVSGTHTSPDPRYAWVNDVVFVGTGEIRPRTGGGPRQVHGHAVDFVIDVGRLVWDGVAD